MEEVIYHDLFKLPISRRNFSAYEGFGFNQTNIDVSLFKREEDPEKPGNLLLKFQVVSQLEVLDIPEVSWNQEDDLDLMTGRVWLLKLTRYRMVSEE